MNISFILLGFALITPLNLVLGAEKILKIYQESDSIEQDPLIESFEIEVQYKELIYHFAKGEPYYLSKMVAKIKTVEPRDLAKYAVVQFIRGCLYSTIKKDGEKVEYYLDSGRQFFGKYIDFKHPEWVVDSNDVDPIYWSHEKYPGRQDLYRLDNPMLNTPPSERKFYYLHYNEEREYYIRDMPTGASGYDGLYVNSSLEFKTCLYRLDQVPTTLRHPTAEEILGKELKCFYWQSNFDFNFDTKKFEMKTSIHPYCLGRNN